MKGTSDDSPKKESKIDKEDDEADPVEPKKNDASGDVLDQPEPVLSKQDDKEVSLEEIVIEPASTVEDKPKNKKDQKKGKDKKKDDDDKDKKKGKEVVKIVRGKSFLMEEQVDDNPEITVKENRQSKLKFWKKKKKKAVWITKEMAETVGREYLLMTTLKETFFYLIFVLFSTLAVVGLSDSSMFHMYKILQDQLLEMNRFEEVNTAAAVWQFLDDMFSKSFYWDYWYYPGQFVKLTNEYDKNILYENKLIGVPRIRQLKVRDNSCPIHEYFKRLFFACYGRFSEASEDTKPFGKKTGTAWTYSPSSELESSSYWGELDWYHGGGYYEDLTVNKQKTLDKIEDLKKNLWITRGTRIVFVELVVYNTNVNLFALVKAAFEFSPTGGVIPSHKIHITKLLKYFMPYDFFLLTCELICLGYIIYYLFEEVREMIFFKLSYFKWFWSYMDCSIILIGLTSFALEVTRFILVWLRLEDILKNTNKYSNLDTPCMLSMFYRNMLAVMLFLIYLKIFKFLNFNKNMAQLNSTLSKCRKDMFGFAVMFFVIFIAFSVLGYLLFGVEVHDFSTFYLAMFTLLRTILGDFDYKDIERANRILAPIFFICFIFLVFFVLLNMFLAIINDTYTDVKTEIAMAPEELQMTGFLKRGYYNILYRMGCGKMLKTEHVQKNEYEITTNEIKAALKRIGFSDIEVEMFYTRYNIDPAAQVNNYDVEALMAALEGNVEPTVPTLEQQEQDRNKPKVAIDDFVKQQQRLDEIEIAIKDATAALVNLLHRLDTLENVRKIRMKPKPEENKPQEAPATRTEAAKPVESKPEDKGKKEAGKKGDKKDEDKKPT